MELSKQIKKLKEKIMLEIHNNNKINMSLEELATHNKNIDEYIKDLEKSKIKIIKK